MISRVFCSTAFAMKSAAAELARRLIAEGVKGNVTMISAQSG
jgi:hypothetical protein